MNESPLVGFAAYAALLHTLVSRRDVTCERIERRLLNVKDRPAVRIRDRRHFDETLSSCVFEGLPHEAASLPGRLASAHAADGFEPLLQHAYPHQLDPAELVVRAYQHWDRTRWPGASGRLAFARALWGVFMLRLLQDLTLRIWDDGDENAPARLQHIQQLLDAVNGAVDSGALVRDARWLLQVAQGPLTRGLAPYFRVAESISRSLTGEDAIAVHAAGAKLAGGHLRSQLRARAAELSHPYDSPQVLAVTRNSNSMDVALLLWDLVPLLDAYQSSASDPARRLALADAIVQGVSADPELLLARIDLLGPCTAVETVFVHAEGSCPSLTPIGNAHALVLAGYATLLDQTAPALLEDARAFDPATAAHSPLGIEYGFCGDLLANMATDGLRGAAAAEIAVEDVFTHGGDAARKQARARFAYSHEWAQDVFARTRRALEHRAARPGRANASDTPGASLVLRPGDEGPGDAQEFCVSSDVNLALATGATAFPRGQILIDRVEGRYLASAQTDGCWFGISKIVLSERIAQGRDAVLAGVPQDVVDILRLTCDGLWRV